MQIQKVYIENMHNVKAKDYVFDWEHIYLHGRNGAGKSTVLQAIQFALLGYVPITGKTKSHVHLLTKSRPMTVELTLRDGDNEIFVKRSLYSIGGKNYTELTVIPEEVSLDAVIADLELPIFNFDEFLGMTANMQKDWFLKFLPPSSKSIDVRSLMMDNAGVSDTPESVKAFMDECLLEWDRQRETSESTLEALQEFNKYLKNMQSFKKSEQTRISGTINSLIRYDDETADASMINVLQQKRDEWIKQRDAARDYISMKSRYDQVTQLIDQLGENLYPSIEEDPEYCAAMATFTKVNDNWNNLSTHLNECRTKRDSILVKMSQFDDMIKNVSGICPFTHEECISAASAVSNVKSNYSLLQEQYMDMNNRINDISNSIQKLDSQKKSLNDRINKMRETYNKYTQLKAVQVEVPPVPEVVDMAIIDKAVADLEKRILQIQANVTYNSMADRLTKEKFAVDLELVVIKNWITLTGPNGLQSSISEEPFHEMENSMNVFIHQFFGEGIDAKFILSEKANSFSFGIMRDATYVPFTLLSSGEKCMFSLALMCSIVDRSKSEIKVLLIDDLFDHLDDGHCAQVFDIVSKMNSIQFIIAGVVSCPEAFGLKVIEVCS